jgi:hypothetical protein
MKLFVWALCALGLLVPGAVAAQSKPTTFGKNLVRSYELPAEAVARFVRFNAAQAAKGVTAGLLADSEDWQGEVLSAPSKGNPYTQVVRVSGTVVADGDVSTSWQGGWSLDGMTRSGLIGGANVTGAKAGQRVSLVGVGGPISFKEDRSLAPALGFMRSRNIQIDGVQLEVWSGVGKPTFVQLIFSWSPLLVGLVFLGIFFWFRRSG